MFRLHQCITFELLMSADSWSFKVGGADVSVPIHSRLIVNTAESAIDAAIAGVGVTRVLSYQIEQAQRSGSLTVVLKDFESEPSPVSLVYTSQGRVPLKLRAVLDFAAPRLREQLSSR